MKSNKFAIIIPLVFVFLLSGGCSKRLVDAPDSGSTADELSSGTDINYPPAEYSEEVLPKEGTLDDAVINNPPTTASATSMNIGRTSAGMQPIYFYFDQSTIPQNMTEILIQNATFLKENPTLNVIVEGNCDDRGAKEYNMALGERRALNTKEFLADLGIHINRVRTVSYGEEQPVDMDNNESAWAKNRRVDFVTE